MAGEGRKAIWGRCERRKGEEKEHTIRYCKRASECWRWM